MGARRLKLIKEIETIKKFLEKEINYDSSTTEGRKCSECGFPIEKPKTRIWLHHYEELCDNLCDELGIGGWPKRTVKGEYIFDLLEEFSNSGQVTGSILEDVNRLAHLIYEELHPRIDL